LTVENEGGRRVYDSEERGMSDSDCPRLSTTSQEEVGGWKETRPTKRRVFSTA